MDSAIYFGIPGQARKLYDPAGGLLATRDIASSVFVTGDGGARVSKAYAGNRTYVLNYGALGRENYDWLNNFQQGHMGVGPFVLLDPGRRNLLTVNQSSGTSAANDTRDFTVAGVGGTISSDASLVTPFPRTLKWLFSTTTPATASITLDKPSKVPSWYGIPVIPRWYTFWCMVVGGPVNLNLSVSWMSSSGAVLGTTTSATLTTSATNWQRISASAIPPVGTVWAKCQLLPVVATIAAGEFINLTSFMFHEGDQPEAWTGGTGVYPVQIVGLPERYGFAEPGMLVSPTMTLQEVR